MDFGRDKDGGESAGAPPPDASARVEDPTEETIAAPPPSSSDRVDEPTAVQPTRESEGPAKVLPPSDAETSAGPQSAAPAPSAADRVEDPGAAQTATAASPVEPGPPSSADRVDSPPPTAATRVDSPAGPPTAATRVDSPAPSAPPQAGRLVSAAPPTAATRVDSPAAAPPQPGQLVSAARPARTGQTACPKCGTPADSGQEMCIVCGSRIARRPSKQRGWLLPAVLAGLGVLLIGTAVAFGVVELTKDDEVKKNDVADLNEDKPTKPPATQPPPAATPPTQPSPTIPPATREPDDPAGPPDAQPDTPDTTPAPTTPGGGNEIAEWPAGKTAYTVVLVSATSRNAADAKAEQAISRGIKAGVLRSDDFATLRPGYWVVFAGQFDSSEQATRAADRYAEQGFGGGYPRQVKPK